MKKTMSREGRSFASVRERKEIASFKKKKEEGSSRSSLGLQRARELRLSNNARAHTGSSRQSIEEERSSARRIRRRCCRGMMSGSLSLSLSLSLTLTELVCYESGVMGYVATSKSTNNNNNNKSVIPSQTLVATVKLAGEF